MFTLESNCMTFSANLHIEKLAPLVKLACKTSLV